MVYKYDAKPSDIRKITKIQSIESIDLPMTIDTPASMSPKIYYTIKYIHDGNSPKLQTETVIYRWIFRFEIQYVILIKLTKNEKKNNNLKLSS